VVLRFAFLALLLLLAVPAVGAAPKTGPVYASTKEGRRAAYEGALFLRVPVRGKGGMEAAAKKFTGNSKNADAILAATGRKRAKIPAEVRIPFRLLTEPFRVEVLSGLFPEDRRVSKGWEHSWKTGPMAGRDGWDSLAAWFSTSDGNGPAIRDANRNAGVKPKPGAKVIVPTSLLDKDIRALRPARGEDIIEGNDQAVPPEEPPPTKPGKAPTKPALPEEGAGPTPVYGPPPPPPLGPSAKTYGPPPPPDSGAPSFTEVPMEPVPKDPAKKPTPKKPEPEPEKPTAKAPPLGPANSPAPSAPGLPPAPSPGPQRPPSLPAADSEEPPTDAPLLEYGKDEKGPYALYRLRPQEALYSAVAVRFTGRLAAAEVNEEAFKIARRSGIDDVTTIPVGFGVKIPLDDLLPDYLPKDDKRYKAWLERKKAAAQFTNTYKSTALEGVVVILDAGHGGNDRGAIQNGVWEDSYVYDIACRIHEGLESRTKARVLMTLHNPNLGYKPQDKGELAADKGAVILTHPWYKPEESSESKAGVNLRWYLANQYFMRLQKEGVDPQRVVFTSIHADSLHPSLRGAMFYVAGAEYRKTRWSTKGTVYNAYEEYNAKPVYTATEKELERSEGLSYQFARSMENALKKAKIPVHKYGATRDHVVRGGRSWVPAVIRNSAIPCSVLMEVCNLNNPEDARLLRDAEYRQAVADAYIAALLRYYS
jgi:N-acetylmuramoyl-L-alanine amidase